MIALILKATLRLVANKYLLESGGAILLEDGTSVLLLE